jgi:sec-independent protein translocase protein TatC
VLPLFLLLLNTLGILSGKAILKPWRFAIFLIFLFTAAFTPTPDPVTMTLLAIPLCLLYFFAGLISVILDKRKKRAFKDEFLPPSEIDKPEKI